jgi:hypothetical protein
MLSGSSSYSTNEPGYLNKKQEAIQLKGEKYEKG